uniref:YfcL family protein n=1 Tax=Ningiella ruwaisensis TaxID=2364274 RepID=UPI0014481E33|nr:YfcL family protein [Ningiella ruwaisensis]
MTNQLKLSYEQENYLEQKEQFLDQFIESNDEYKLFVSSYIHGHFSVVVANLPEHFTEVDGLESVDLDTFSTTFEQNLRRDIDQAIENNELSSEDAGRVSDMLEELFA